jgi:hypothetical protein
MTEFFKTFLLMAEFFTKTLVLSYSRYLIWKLVLGLEVKPARCSVQLTMILTALFLMFKTLSVAQITR